MNDYLRAEKEFLEAPDPDNKCFICNAKYDLVEYNDELYCDDCSIMGEEEE